MRLAYAPLLGALSIACSPSSPAEPAFDPQVTFPEQAAAPAPTAAADAAPSLPAPKGNTWSYLYATYFAGTSAAATPGHCGASRCHLNTFHGFRCGPDGNTCYAGMVGVGLINPAQPTSSLIGQTNNSPLVWTDPANGIMPLDEAKPNPQGAADILAWLDAGATNDLPPPEAGADAPEASSADAPTDAQQDAGADAPGDAPADGPQIDATSP